jgi:photosystem II stability/assembly factor-like uncharacterized protein
MKILYYICVIIILFSFVDLLSQINWKTQSLNSPIRCLNINGSRIRVYQDNSMFFSSDMGNNWSFPYLFSQQNNMPINGYFIKDSIKSWIVCYNNTNGYYNLYKTINGGLNWIQIYSNIGFGPNNKSIYFVDDNTGWMCGGTYYFPKRIIIKTTNAGTNWNIQYQESLSNYHMNENIYMINNNTGFVTCGIDSFLVTRDGGNNWIKKYCGIGTSQYLSLIDFVNSNVGYMLNEYPAIIKTTDGGNNWSAISISTPATNAYSMFFLNEQTGWVGGNYGYIFKTTNGGNNWITQVNYHGASFYSVNTINFLNSSTGWFGDNNGEVYKSTNGGGNWTLIRQVPKGNFSSIGFINFNTGFVINSEGKIWKTINKGNSWTSNFDAGTTLRFVYPDLSDGCYITGNNGILLFSSNYGTNWSQKNIGSTAINEIYFTSDNTGWIISDNGNMFRTTNEGQNWNQLQTYTTENLVSLSFINLNTGWIVGSLGKIYKTTNGGLNWDTSRLNENISAVTFKNQNTGILATVGKYYWSPGGYFYLNRLKKTTNGGLSWTLQYEYSTGSANYQPFYPIRYSDSVFVWTVSSLGKYGYSINDGTNWGIGDFFTGLNNVFFKSISLGWIAGNNIILGTDEAFIGIRNINIKYKDLFILEQNYPNPFNSKTLLKFSLPKNGSVIISIYDVLGKKVFSNEEYFKTGLNEKYLDFGFLNLSTGIYFIKIYFEDNTKLIKAVYLK